MERKRDLCELEAFETSQFVLPKMYDIDTIQTEIRRIF